MDEERTVDLSKFTHAPPLQDCLLGPRSCMARLSHQRAGPEWSATRVVEEQRGVGHVEIRVKRVGPKSPLHVGEKKT